MASGVKPRVKVPKKAAAGDTITIKTLISHKMESGQRKDKEGNFAHSNIITVLNSKGEIVHRQEGLSADPAETLTAIAAAQ